MQHLYDAGVRRVVANCTHPWTALFAPGAEAHTFVPQSTLVSDLSGLHLYAWSSTPLIFRLDCLLESGIMTE